MSATKSDARKHMQSVSPAPDGLASLGAQHPSWNDFHKHTNTPPAQRDSGIQTLSSFILTPHRFQSERPQVEQAENKVTERPGDTEK